ncbi:MAG TPA: hypothetical protein VI197_01315 [Polyangiaceae bacterium]
MDQSAQSTGDGTRYPILSFFPAVQFARNLELGEWVIGTPPSTTAWRPPPFRELATALLESSERSEFKKPALLWHREHGFDGSAPEDAEVRAIQAAVRFALLDYNDQVPRDYNTAYRLATSENGVLYRQPIDEVGRSVAHEMGGALKSALVGGWKIGERPVSLPDATQAIDRPVRVSQCLSAAVYAGLLAEGQAAQRMAIAIEWHAVALANPRAVTLQQRIIALKTGFEALFGESNSVVCARALRRLFEDATRAHHALFPWPGCLWSPTERVDLPRQYKDRKGRIKPVIRSELEDWFVAFADVRNSIIHEGRIPTDAYQAPPERPLSRYAGHFFWIGERVLREAIKATLGPEILLCGLLAQRKRYEKFAPEILEWLASQLSVKPPTAPPVPRAPEPTARSLATLLDQLKCEAANAVQVHKGVPTHHEARAPMDEYWVAEVGPIEVMITPGEKELLKQAGAEDRLREDFEACD